MAVGDGGPRGDAGAEGPPRSAAWRECRAALFRPLRSGAHIRGLGGGGGAIRAPVRPSGAGWVAYFHMAGASLSCPPPPPRGVLERPYTVGGGVGTPSPSNTSLPPPPPPGGARVTHDDSASWNATTPGV